MDQLNLSGLFGFDDLVLVDPWNVSSFFKTFLFHPISIYFHRYHLLPQFWQGSCTSVSSRKCQAHTWVKQLACIGQRFVAILFGTWCPMITLTHRNSIFRQNHIEAYWSNFAEILALLWLSMVFRCRMASCSMNVCTSSSTARRRELSCSGLPLPRLSQHGFVRA